MMCGSWSKDFKRLGFDPGPIDGTYDETTSSAVSKWYKSAGYEPFGPTSEQLANIRTIETALADATKGRMQTASAASAADLGVEAARAKAQQAEKAALADIEAGIAERELVSRDPRKLAQARSAAEAKIEAGRAALRAARTQGELTVQEALEGKKIAQLDAPLAADRLDRLATELSGAQRQLGVQVPLDEIVFIPALPVRVQEVTAAVGGSASGPVLSVTDNQITIYSSLALDAAPFVKPEMEVHIDEPAYGVKARGVVEKVENTPGTHGVDGYHIYFAVRVDYTPVPLDGFSLRLTIPVKSTKRAVITVPLSAVFLAADGTSRVQVDNHGTLTNMVVEPGLAANGYVEVTPLDGALTPGQLVVVGSKNGE